jgi:hypothetical protein
LLHFAKCRKGVIIVKCVFICLLLALADPPVEPASSQPAEPEVKETVTQAQVEALVKRLSARDFSEREAAQRELTAMGEKAARFLVPHVTGPDTEVAVRVAAILGTPRDPEVRVELCLRLIESADPDWLERGVHVLFERPDETYAPFMKRSQDGGDLMRVILAPIREQFESWKRQDDMFQRTYARTREKDPARAEQLRRLHEETSLYCAEAAYWGAVEALAEYQGLRLESDDSPDPPATQTDE